jgi:hypothetical protein
MGLSLFPFFKRKTEDGVIGSFQTLCIPNFYTGFAVRVTFLVD